MGKKKTKRMYPCRMEIVGMPPDRQYPWKNGDYVLLLGEIVDMRGHSNHMARYW